jgi:hypothetical protein
LDIFFQLGGVIKYDEYREEVILAGEAYDLGKEFDFFSWSKKLKEIERNGVLNADLGFVMDEFILPYLHPEKVVKGIRIGIDLDKTFPISNSGTQTGVKGDLLDWATSTGIFTGAILVWIGKNLSHFPPYGFVEPFGGRLSSLKGVKDLSISFFKDPQRKWGGSFPDKAMAS